MKRRWLDVAPACLVLAALMFPLRGGFTDDGFIHVQYARNLMHFYAHESCGQCTPCREGTDWLVKIFKRIEAGGGREGDVQLFLDLCDNIEGKSFCPLGDAAAWPIQSAIKRFPEDFQNRLKH